MNNRRTAISSLIGVSIAILIPLAAVFIFKYKEKDRHMVHFPKIYFPMGLDTTVDDKGQPQYDTVYHTIPEFSFMSQDGQLFSSRKLKGHLWIANFFYTSCPGICPVMNRQMQKVQNEFLGDDQVRLVSFTTDPERDSIATLKYYSQQQNAVPGKWYFLRAGRKEIQDLARNAFRVTVVDGDNGDGEVEHSDKLILIDEKGRIRGYYNGTDSMDVRNLMGDIVLILSRMNK